MDIPVYCSVSYLKERPPYAIMCYTALTIFFIFQNHTDLPDDSSPMKLPAAPLDGIFAPLRQAAGYYGEDEKYVNLPEPNTKPSRTGNRS
jgi:hypothetical protein